MKYFLTLKNLVKEEIEFKITKEFTSYRLAVTSFFKIPILPLFPSSKVFLNFDDIRWKNYVCNLNDLAVDDKGLKPGAWSRLHKKAAVAWI